MQVMKTGAGSTGSVARNGDSNAVESSQERPKQDPVPATVEPDTAAVRITLSTAARHYLASGSSQPNENKRNLTTSLTSLPVSDHGNIVVQYVDPLLLDDSAYWDAKGGSRSIEVFLPDDGEGISTYDIGRALMSRGHEISQQSIAFSIEAHRVRAQGLQADPTERMDLPGVSRDVLLAMSPGEYLEALGDEASRLGRESSALMTEAGRYSNPDGALQNASAPTKSSYSAEQAKSELQNYVVGLYDYIGMRNWSASHDGDPETLARLDGVIKYTMDSMDMFFGFDKPPATFSDGVWTPNAVGGTYSNGDVQYEFSLDDAGQITDR